MPGNNPSYDQTQGAGAQSPGVGPETLDRGQKFLFSPGR